jgi:hypothetical protein
VPKIPGRAGFDPLCREMPPSGCVNPAGRQRTVRLAVLTVPRARTRSSRSGGGRFCRPVPQRHRVRLWMPTGPRSTLAKSRSRPTLIKPAPPALGTPTQWQRPSPTNSRRQARPALCTLGSGICSLTLDFVARFIRLAVPRRMSRSGLAHGRRGSAGRCPS